ncbi:MAG: hypothetical protein ABIJ96_03705 [Elusimicrobiota bacterium]
MNLLNLYFTPFATLLVIIAIYFSDPDKSTKISAFAILGVSLLVNHWFSKNTYRFVGWAGRLKHIQIWLTYAWSALLFYLLFPYWAPMWLLLSMPAVTAALFQTRLQTALTGLISGGTVIGVYYLRWRGNDIPAQLWAQAAVHAGFIPVLALFVHALAQTALKMRDIRARL